MHWEVEYTDEFGAWWETLTSDEQTALKTSVDLLALFGPTLSFPHCSSVHGAKHSPMRELHTQHSTQALRTLYAFDAKRCAIVLLGGDKD